MCCVFVIFTFVFRGLICIISKLFSEITVEEVKVGKDMDTVHIIVEEVKVAVLIGMSGE
jgi:hypothetical protein